MRTRDLPESLLARLSRFVEAQTGLDFSRERWPDLARAVEAARAELGLADAESAAHTFLARSVSKHHLEVLAKHLTVGETYFFRDRKVFEALEKHVLPERIRARRGERRLRIWSAACCTGEEPYSLAILLNRLLPDLRDWRATILATDINTAFLHKAVAGVYGKWSFRNTLPDLQSRHFRPTADGRFEILPRYKELVTFACLNLVGGDYPSLANNTNAMDLILCRNVLIYFSAEQARGVALGLGRSLVEDGWLVTSPTEASHTLFAPLVPVELDGAICFRKTSATAVRAHLPPALPAELPAAATPPAPSSAAAPPAPPARIPATAVRGPTDRLDEPGEAASLLLDEARRHFAQGDYVRASQLLERHLAAGKPERGKGAETGALALLARSKASEGKLAEALECCERAVARDKLDPALHYLRGTILQELDRIDPAIHAFQRALYLDQDFVLAHFALGSLLRGKAIPREASRHFDSALRILRDRRPEEILPDGSGLTAGHLAEIIASMKQLSA